MRKTAVCVVFICLAIFALGWAQTYSWQAPNAAVDPKGDLSWAPEPFAYSPGASVVYIDYEAGDDNNSGQSRSSALKHHPWDPNATGNAQSMSGVKTYVFKRGVIYRGRLIADESGQPGNPIILTSDPTWGSGEAGIYGSERITGGWTRCDAASAPYIPDPAMVWYIDLPFSVECTYYSTHPSCPAKHIQMLTEVTDSGLKRINVARAPNWDISEDVSYPQRKWWRSRVPAPLSYDLPDTFTAGDAVPLEVWQNGTFWTGSDGNMGTLQQSSIENYSDGMITGGGVGFEVAQAAFFYIERLPFALDAPNEFYYNPDLAPHSNRLYLRLSGDRDPNTAIIEVGARPDIIDMVAKSHITISGLSFAMTNQSRPAAFDPDPAHWGSKDGICQAIELSGVCSGITITNCTFSNLVMAIAPGRGNESPSCSFADITITDNDFDRIDDQTITLPTSVRRLTLLRNRLSFVGERQQSRVYAPLAAINVQGVVSADIAGNIVDVTWGQGINLSASSGTGGEPRVFIHHNKVTHSLLGTNDWGGIETWGSGPVFMFSNISGDPRGYAGTGGANQYAPWGHAFYMDHAQGHKAFNNIAFGINNDPNLPYERSGSGLMNAASTNNLWANNTVYKLFRGIGFTQRGCSYVGNLFDDITDTYVLSSQDNEKVAWAGNVFGGSTARFSGQTGLAVFAGTLLSEGAMCSQLGQEFAGELMANPANGDYTPIGDAVGNGARIFVAWHLANTSGQWNFYRDESAPGTIVSENAPGSDGNVLTCPGADSSFYVAGALEDWTAGALHLNGIDRYCSASNTSAFNVDQGSLILEAYVKSTAGGPVMSKGGANGYMLDIAPTGKARVTLKTYTLSSAVDVNDGSWHHILAELDRPAGTVSLFVDGSLSNGAVSGALPSSLSCSDSFYVGRAADSYLEGDIDFARVSRGSLADAGSSFEELYAWEFDGPAQRDFGGRLVEGPRDAGAVQSLGSGTRPGASSSRRALDHFAVASRIVGQHVVLQFGDGFRGTDPVSIVIVTAAGRQVAGVRTTVGALGTGRVAEMDGRRWARGFYLLRVSTPRGSLVERIMLPR